MSDCGWVCLQASDCSWLYFDQGLLEPIFGAALKRPQDAHQLPYILAAFMDAHQLLQHAPLPPDKEDAAPKTQVSQNNTDSATARLATRVACEWLHDLWAGWTQDKFVNKMLLVLLCMGTSD